MPDLEKLFANNRNWSRRMREADPDFFNRLSSLQSPKYLWIGCSDSRVSANEILGLAPGEVFVHRNVANLVVPTDLNCLSVIQFAVEVLRVEHILVCGHYGCGGVRAALGRAQLGLIDYWLRNIKETYARHRQELECIDDPSARADRLCELNVLAQVRSVCHTTIVQNAWASGRQLAVHGVIYRLNDGLLHDLALRITRADQLEAVYRMDEGKHHGLAIIENMVPVSNAGDPGWFSRERVLLLALGAATLLALYVCYLIVQPFIPAVTIAVAAAVATQGPQAWLRRRLGSHTAAAAVGVTLVAGLIVVPLSLLITYLVRQIIASIHGLQTGGGLSEWRSIVNLPPAIGRVLDWAQANLDLQAQLTGIGQSMAGQAGNLLAGSLGLVTQLVIMLFVLFFLYRDRDRALHALRHLVPLSAAEAGRMASRIEDTILAMVNGSLTVAFVQALLAGVMYTALGVPAASIWACVTFIVALIPIFGTFMVWGPVAVFLVLSGSWVKAVILVAWGALAVSTVDNLLYPYLVGGRLRLHTIPTFFAILGGVQLFGPSGLILGPVALAVTIGLLDIWASRTSGGHTAEQTAPQ